MQSCWCLWSSSWTWFVNSDVKVRQDEAVERMYMMHKSLSQFHLGLAIPLTLLKAASPLKCCLPTVALHLCIASCVKAATMPPPGATWPPPDPGKPASSAICCQLLLMVLSDSSGVGNLDCSSRRFSEKGTGSWKPGRSFAMRPSSSWDTKRCLFCLSTTGHLAYSTRTQGTWP